MSFLVAIVTAHWPNCTAQHCSVLDSTVCNVGDLLLTFIHCFIGSYVKISVFHCFILFQLFYSSPNFFYVILLLSSVVHIFRRHSSNLSRLIDLVIYLFIVSLYIGCSDVIVTTPYHVGGMLCVNWTWVKSRNQTILMPRLFTHCIFRLAYTSSLDCLQAYVVYYVCLL